MPRAGQTLAAYERRSEDIRLARQLANQQSSQVAARNLHAHLARVNLDPQSICCGAVYHPGRPNRRPRDAGAFLQRGELLLLGFDHSARDEANQGQNGVVGEGLSFARPAGDSVVQQARNLAWRLQEGDRSKSPGRYSQATKRFPLISLLEVTGPGPNGPIGEQSPTRRCGLPHAGEAICEAGRKAGDGEQEDASYEGDHEVTRRPPPARDGRRQHRLSAHRGLFSCPSEEPEAMVPERLTGNSVPGTRRNSR